MQKDNIGLLLYGSVGSGKSFLASCIANYLIEEKLLSVKMRNFAEIINDLQSGGFSLDKNKYIMNYVYFSYNSYYFDRKLIYQKLNLLEHDEF